MSAHTTRRTSIQRLVAIGCDSGVDGTRSWNASKSDWPGNAAVGDRNVMFADRNQTRFADAKPVRSVLGWIKADAEAFRDRYALVNDGSANVSVSADRHTFEQDRILDTRPTVDSAIG